MVVGEIFLSAFIQVLFQKLLSPELIKLARREGVHSAIMKLEKTLREIQAVLNDAEEKQIADEAVQLWLEELRDLAYDADDIVDEFATEALRRRMLMMAEPPQSSTSMVRCLMIPSCCTTFSPSSLAFNFRIGSKIKELNKQLEDIATRKTKLGLVDQKYANVGETSYQWHRPPTSSLPSEPSIYGRDKVKEDIIELLLKADAPTGNNFGVIPIVGMGGIGKTTLAQLVYNDDKVKNHFNMKAWFCVSDEDFDVTRITRAILDDFTRTTCDLKELNALQVKLNETLMGKKFLLVLDDVWNKSWTYDQWSRLSSPFRAGAHGSQIIVTTRDNEVALHMGGGSIQSHHLDKLSDDDCWLIFAKHAFQNKKNISQRPKLESIGKKIAEKCGGLPLAARTLGGLLRCKQTDEEWEDVLNSEIWKLSYEKNGVLPALKVSYHHLPSHLKRCFDYCTVIPNDYVFEEKEMVLLWMAQGFIIHKPQGNQQIEDLGCQYFRELVSRSFFQPSSTSSTDNSQFIMHDLINELAQVVAGKMCFRLENGELEGGSQYKIAKKVRHLSYTSRRYDGIKRFEVLRQVECSLRTFLPFTSSKHFAERFITSYVPRDLLPKLKCLRVLCLSNYEIYELPDSIGDLKHLRYLNLSNTRIRRLPKSTGTLYNLQVMLLKGCENLKELPLNMGNLINLRHLDITDARSLKEMPLQMGKLTNLQTLSSFVVVEGSGSSSIRELGNLQQLRGSLSISRLENVTDAGDAREVNLKDKQGIKELSLEWRNAGIDTDSDHVLGFLQPHLELEKLSIHGYAGRRFSTWLGDASFSRMVFLRLQGCRNCKSLPPLGQLPSLKDLEIRRMSGVEQVGPEFYGEGCPKPFPSLENLMFRHMEEWKEWKDQKEVIEPFTRLSKLCICDCSKLVGKLPNHLPSLKQIVTENCPQLVIALPSFGMLRNLVDLLWIKDVSIHAFFCIPDHVADEVVLANVASNHLKSVTQLHVSNIPKLTSLPLWFLQGLTGLEELTIISCGELASLWPNEVQLQHHLLALRRLKIWSCPHLFCLFEGKEEELRPCLMTLEYLQIGECKKLPRDLHALSYLGNLMIFDCPKLVSFPKTGLPSTLRTLEISKCRALESLTEGLLHSKSIQVLGVRDCPSLTSLSSTVALPPTLKVLRISDCENLESIVDKGLKINSPLDIVDIWGCKNLKSLPDGPHNLSELRIGGCDNIESLPEGWLSATSLRKLEISKCRKLEALPMPNHAHNLTSLQQLHLSDFPGAVSFLQGNFPFPTNLNSLSIRWNLPSLSEWGLHRLSCLTKLHINGGTTCSDLVSFPDPEGRNRMSLPASLTEVHIENFPNLEYLSSEFQNLISLEKLEISYCPKLTSFPDQGFPRSLLQLSIWGCPRLQQRLKRDRGKYWPIIAHIPYITIDWRSLFDPEVDYSV